LLSSEFCKEGQVSLDHGADQFVAQFKVTDVSQVSDTYFEVYLDDPDSNSPEFSLHIGSSLVGNYFYTLDNVRSDESYYSQSIHETGQPIMGQPEFRYLTIRYHPDLLEFSLDEMVLLSIPNPHLSGTAIRLSVHSDFGEQITKVDDFFIWDTRDLESAIPFANEDVCSVTKRRAVYSAHPDDLPGDEDPLPYVLFPGTPLQVEDAYQTAEGVDWNQVRVGTFFTVWIPSEVSTASCQPVASAVETGCVLTGAALPRDAPSASESNVLESAELEAFSPVSVRDFAVDDEGQIWGHITWDESNLQGASGYVLARDLSIECQTVSASETKRSDLNDPDPPSSDLDYVNASEPVALWRMGEKDDGSTWLHIYGSGVSGQGEWELGWVPASSLAQSCFTKLGSAICTVTRYHQNKDEPDPYSGGGPGNYSSVGDKLSARENTIGSGGKVWYSVINMTTGGAGWLPSGVLTEACKQFTPES